MNTLTSPGDRDLVVKRLIERRKHFGELTRSEVAKAAASCGVSQSTMYRWLIAGTALPRTRSNYKLTETDLDAFFLASGDSANAYGLLKRSDGPSPPSLSTYRRAIMRELSEARSPAQGTARERLHRIRSRCAERRIGETSDGRRTTSGWRLK